MINLFSKFKNKTIGVLYICTGKYHIFWEQFFISSEKNFCPSIKKEYFLFSDYAFENLPNNVHLIYQEKLGWPNDTLMRFHMFQKAFPIIQTDYLFFFNANIVFTSRIKASEILPSLKEKLVAVIHPHYYETPIGAPFEKNKESTAYVNESLARHYVQGCLNGGERRAYMEMINELASNIDKDLNSNFIAIWHDESQLNAYLINHNPNYKALHPGFAKPEMRQGFPFKQKLIQLDKSKLGGHNFLRS